MSLRRSSPSFLVLLGALALPSTALTTGCGDDAADGSGGSASPSTTTGPAEGGGGAGQGGGSGGADDVPDPICRGATAWSEGNQAFEDATSDWQLDAIGAAGTRLNAVDFDGDGWTDLFVRTGADLRDDFAEGGVRASWLLRNRGDGTFEDVTESSGIRTPRDGGALGQPGDTMAFADVDQDGDVDAITAPVEKPGVGGTTEVLLNDGTGHFSLASQVNGLSFPAGGEAPAAVVFVDVNGDGIVDVWMPRNAYNGGLQQARLFHGVGDGTFVDQTEASGLFTSGWTDLDAINEGRAHANSWSGAACDLDGDGNLELLTASYGRAPSHLWKALGAAGNHAFQNIGLDSGYAYDDRTDWTDNESARCWCTLHPTDDECEGVPEPQYIACDSDEDAFRWSHDSDREPFRLGGNSGATICGDVDNDGDVDLLTTAIVHWDVGSSSDPAELLINTGDPAIRFDRPGPEVTGLSREYDFIDWNEGIMSGSLFDFDNDGSLDVYWGGSDYPGQRGLLYRQDGPAHFAAVPIEDGIDHHRSHGSAVADFDHDGDLDIVVGHSTARCEGDDMTPCYPTQQVRFFRNVIGQGGNHIAISLKGVTSNTAAIGARVTVTANGVTQTRDVDGGHGHFGAQDDLAVFFGLGDACEVDVTVRWPDAAHTTQTHHLQGNYRWTITEGGRAAVAP